MRPIRTALSRTRHLIAGAAVAVLIVFVAVNGVRTLNGARAQARGQAIVGITLTSEKGGGNANPNSNPNTTNVFYISGDVNGLYPGLSTQLPLTVTNPNTDDLQVNSLSVSVTGTSDASCPAGNIQVSNYSGPSFIVAKNNGTATVNVPISMPASAGDPCQGVTFNLQYSGSGQQASGTTTYQGNLTCSATKPVPGSTVTGNLLVPVNGVCTLNGVTVLGNVNVKQGGSLTGINGIHIGKDLQANQAVKVSLDQGTTVGAALDLSSVGGVRVIVSVALGFSITGTNGTSAGSPNYVCASSVGGAFALRSSSSSAPFSIGGLPPCSAGNTTGPGKALTINGNQAPVVVANNHVGGNLVCKGNSSVASSNNSVNGKKQGQCA